jgi:hypothetical protein
VDYTSPIQKCWKLTNYWGARLTDGAEVPHQSWLHNGLFHVTTLGTNTYALVWTNVSGTDERRVAELTTNGLRLTTTAPFSTERRLEPDGSKLYPDVSGSTASFYRSRISGWGGANGTDPIYTEDLLTSVNFTAGVEPNPTQIKTNAGMIFVLDEHPKDPNGTLRTNKHIGLVKKGATTTWGWLNSPAGPLNTKGNFETNAGYGATAFALQGDNLFYFYEGEFWQGSAGKQASQIMHYKTNGTFKGQFGLPRIDGTQDQRPGAAANVQNFSVIQAWDGQRNATFIYTHDEGSHGLHRWKIPKP